MPPTATGDATTVAPNCNAGCRRLDATACRCRADGDVNDTPTGAPGNSTFATMRSRTDPWCKDGPPLSTDGAASTEPLPWAAADRSDGSEDSREPSLRQCGAVVTR